MLGPLLFLIYTNDIQNSTKEKLTLFADDTNIFITDDNAIPLKNRAEGTLRDIKEWFDANKLKVNTTIYIQITVLLSLSVEGRVAMENGRFL